MFVRLAQSFCTGTHLLLVKLVYCFFFFYASLHVTGLLGLIISLSLTNMFSFLAHITGLISEQLLNATVGGSVLFHCPRQDTGNLSRVYWQEGEQHFFQWDKWENNKRPI